MPADGNGALQAIPCEAGVPKPDPILVADGVRKQFGGLVAVNVAHLEVQRGVITALIGPNGAGKSTLFNVLTGFEPASGGQWSFDGASIANAPAHSIARRGMVRTFQLTKALMKMSVVENVKLAAPNQRGERLLGATLPWRWRRQESQVQEQAIELLERFKLAKMRNEYAGTLSGGQRKLLEMARALMVSPKLLMLDEPMAGVNPALTQDLLQHITALADTGTTVVFVEHDMDVVMDISDWVVCMAQGKVIAEGTPSAIAQNRTVIDAYLGAHHDEKDQAEGGGPPA